MDSDYIWLTPRAIRPDAAESVQRGWLPAGGRRQRAMGGALEIPTTWTLKYLAAPQVPGASRGEQTCKMQLLRQSAEVGSTLFQYYWGIDANTQRRGKASCNSLGSN